jgi:hypothetical protein
MPEPEHDDVAEPKHEDLAEPLDEDVAEPVDEDAADSEPPSGRHRSPGDPDQPRERGSSPTRWVALAAVLIAVIALAGTAWALFLPSWLPRPSKVSSPVTTSPPVSSNTSPHFTDQQIADAKSRACGASDTVSRALTVQTGADVGKDPLALLALAANARLVMIGGGQYLLERLDPATPAPLAAAIRTYSDQLQDIGLYAMAGTPNDDPAQAARNRDIQATNAQIADLCK